METQAPKPGTLVRGTVPTTGKSFTGWLRGPHAHHRSNGLWVVDNPKWDGNPEHMPASQALVVDIRPVKGQELEDIMAENLAKRVLAGDMTREEAAKELVRTKKIARQVANDRIDEAIEAIKSEQRAASKAATKPSKRVSAKPNKEPMAKVEPARFAALRDELGMSNKQCAAANEAAGLGATLSRITELTHSKGAGEPTFLKVEAAWRDWAAKHNEEVNK